MVTSHSPPEGGRLLTFCAFLLDLKSRIISPDSLEHSNWPEPSARRRRSTSHVYGPSTTNIGARRDLFASLVCMEGRCLVRFAEVVTFVLHRDCLGLKVNMKQSCT